MSGKKQSQRTKNNVRPSSSSRSAELLSNSISLDGGFMTISGGKVLPALFPTLATVNIDQGLSPEYQMCMKKLNKKDPITRAKALQELCDLISKGSIEDAVAALPAWAHFYKTLTADTDRKVREMTQLCHGTLVRICGRRTAPQLKALLPAWLQAQYDEHAPAMAHAQNSLKSTFPDAKLPEVISFCKTEVMAHILDNLIGSTESIVAKNLKDEEDLFENYPLNMIENVEERELQMSRIVTSSLRGLEYFVPSLPAPHHDWLWSALTPLLDHNAYWKMATHNVQQVRAAWFGAMGRVSERFGAALGARCGPRLLRALLGAARDSLVAHHVWTCLLLFMHHVQDWQRYLDKKELLLKRILDVLETGGWGDARHLSTMLLPLLAHLPRDLLTKEFYEAFFNAIFKGLNRKNIISSKSERQSWITSLAECLRYLSIQEHEFVVEVVTSVHRTWLETALSPQHDAHTRTNLVRCSCTSMTSLVKYWLKRSDETKTDKYDQLLRNFWQNVGSTILAQIDKCGTDSAEMESLVGSHILLLKSLKTTFAHDTRKQLSIKFENSADEEERVESGPVEVQQCDAALVDRYNHSLDELVHKVISHYLETAERRQAASAVLTPLVSVLTEFDSASVYAAVARHLGLGSVLQLYHDVLRRWLTDDTMRCRAVVDIVFLMMKYLPEGEQDAVYDSFDQFRPSVVEWCAAAALSDPRGAAARRWARGPLVGATLRALAARATRHHDAPAATLLLACLSDGPDGGLVVGLDGVCSALREVSAALSAGRMRGAGRGALEVSARLAARLVTALAPAPHVAAHTDFADLVFALFTLNVLVPCGEGAVSVHTWYEARSSWQDGAAALAAPDTFTQRAAQLFTSLLVEQQDKLNIQNIEHMVSLAPYMFVCEDESSPPSAAVLAHIVAFSRLVLCEEPAHRRRVETCALRHECVTSHLLCVHGHNLAANDVIETSSQQNVEELSEPELTAYVNKVLFRAIYLRTVLLHETVSEGEEGAAWCDTLLTDHYLLRELCNVMYDYTVVLALHDGYTHWQGYDIIETTKSKLEALVKDVVTATSLHNREKVSQSLRALASTHGYFWSYAYGCYSARCGHTLEPHLAHTTDLPHLHMLQSISKFSGDSKSAYRTSYVVMLHSWLEAQCSERSAELLADLARCEPHCDVDVVVQEYVRRGTHFTLDGELCEVSWQSAVSAATLLHFLRLWLSAEQRVVGARFLLTTLQHTLHKIAHCPTHWACTKVAMVSRAALELLQALHEAAQRCSALYSAWDADHRTPVYHSVYTVLQCVLEDESTAMGACAARVVSALVGSLGALEWHRAGRDGAALAELSARAARALLRPAHPAARYLVYHALLNLAKPLVYHDAQKLVAWSESEEGETRPTTALDSFRDVFDQLQDIVETALQNVQLGEETCSLAAWSDSHSMALGWLLLADAQAHMCDLAVGDLKQFYIQMYRENKYIPGVLSCSLRLLPADVFTFALDNSDSSVAPQHYADCFLAVQPFSMRVACSSGVVGALACRCVQTAVCGAGCGAARSWWGAASPRVARALERLVSAYVSPGAVAAQLSQLQRRARELEDAEVRVAWSSREAVCAYRVEESTLELQLSLSRSHPLVAPRLAGGALGGATAHWLALYLAYQHGSLLNALKMWTRVVSARVERSPQCYICYCRLHPATGRLPHVACHQCRNKFHNLCLRKWFATSNKSNCPLCRATF